MSVQVVPAITLIDKARLGYQAVSLDSLTATTAIVVKAGSKIETGGALFDFQADETESGGTWAAISNSNVVYCYITVSGSSATWYYSVTAPTWDTAKQGWYHLSDRCFAFLYKDSGGLYQAKNILPSWSENWTLPVNFPYTNAAPDATMGREHPLPVNNTNRQLFSGAIAAGWSAAIQATGVGGIPAGAKWAVIKVFLTFTPNAAGTHGARLYFSPNNTDTPAETTDHPGMSRYCYGVGAGTTYSDTIQREVKVPLNAAGQFYMQAVIVTNQAAGYPTATISAVSYFMGD